mmetsp:Transcript_136741/g.437413  ORF Transcript_136741/g.437413 Transcript_136741/m.437413 type:complete len:116 (-) Transcript_136741:391-738(-)
MRSSCRTSWQRSDMRSDNWRTFFNAMDSDKSSTVNWQEFEAAFQDPEVVNRWLLLDFRPADCSELFTMLDDGTGEIETSDFFAGLLRMKGQAQAKDVYRLQDPRHLCRPPRKLLG